MDVRRQLEVWRRKAPVRAVQVRLGQLVRRLAGVARTAWKHARTSTRTGLSAGMRIQAPAIGAGRALAGKGAHIAAEVRRQTHQALAQAASSPSIARGSRLLRVGLLKAEARRRALAGAATRTARTGLAGTRDWLRRTPLEPAVSRVDRWIAARRRPIEGRYRIAIATSHSRSISSAGALLLAALIALPAFASRDLINDLIFVFTMLALAQYWNLLAGYAGLVSVGQQAFVGLGGYLLFAFSIHGGIDPLAAIVLAGIFAGVLALPTALVVFRLRGAYFAIGTWVMAEVYRLVFAQFRQLGGGTGTSLPPFVTNEVAGIAAVRAMFDVRTSAARDIITYWAALVLAAGTILLAYVILRSRYGLALAAIRDSEKAAESAGVDSFKTKLKVYVATAAGTGMVGALIYLQKARISPDAAFSVLDWTAYVIFIVVIGGIGTIEGPIIGVLVFYVLQTNLAHFGTWYLILLGVFAIVTMLYAPKGIWGLLAERYGLAIFPTRRYLVARDHRDVARPGSESGTPATDPDSKHQPINPTKTDRS
jgi:branched-chain amino acid transport system permease protein